MSSHFQKLNEAIEQFWGPDVPDTCFVPCGECDGSGIIAHRVTVYEHGCGFPHDDTDERPCPVCLGLGKIEVDVEPVTLSDLEVRAVPSGMFAGNEFARDGATIAGCSAKGVTEPGQPVHGVRIPDGPPNCPHCEYDRRFPGFQDGGWMQQDNNGPIVSCPMCNPDGRHPRS